MLRSIRRSSRRCFSIAQRRTITLAASEQRLKGKVAVITGGANGIGEATSRMFVSQGGRVVIADVQDERGKDLARSLGAAASYVHCDVSLESDVAAMVDYAVKVNGHVDVLFSNAGILGAIGPLEMTNMDEFELTCKVNMTGNFLALKHATRVMKPAGQGSIVITASVAGIVGGLSPHCYAMCKAGVIGLVKSAAVELRDFGIRINSVSPDALPTEFLATALQTVDSSPAAHVSIDKAREIVMRNSLLPHRNLTAVDVARAALFLATDDAGYISGHNLVIDASNTVSKPANLHNWYTEYSPMLREAGRRGLGRPGSSD